MLRCETLIRPSIKRRFNTMRLWVPHLFTILNNFDYERWTEDRAPTIREMLDRRMSVPARDYLDYPDFNNICITVRKCVANAIVSQHWNNQKFFLILFLSHLLFSGKSKRWYTKIPPLSQSRQSCFRSSLAWYTLQSLGRK